MTSLWIEASRDVEREQRVLHLAELKTAVAPLWPFLALARTPQEFTHRLALAEGHLGTLIPAEDLPAVTASLQDDFRILTTAAAPSTDGEENEPDTESDQDEDDSSSSTGKTAFQIFDHSACRWITVTAVAAPTPHNPLFDQSQSEEGPLTGETGTFPVEVSGPDPWNPMNGNTPLPPNSTVAPANRFPAEPQPWVSPPDKRWVENPMNFTPPISQHQGSQDPYYRERLTAEHHTLYGYTAALPPQQMYGDQYRNEGVETGPGPNPFSFADGDEGVAGTAQAGFPADVSLPEPDERVDLYANPPQGGFSGTQPAIQPTTAAKTNAGTCAKCGKPIYRSGQDTWHHLTGETDHGVHLAYDHPWVRSRMSSVRHTAPGGGEHAPYRIEKGDGGYYVVNEKGERKNSKPKSHQQARQFQKALYKNVPGARESAEEDEHTKESSLVYWARTFTEDDRQKAADSGHALSDGSFPIYTKKDVENAKHDIGRTGHDRSTVVEHINHWAEQLGASKVGEDDTTKKSSRLPQFFDPTFPRTADAASGDMYNGTANPFATGGGGASAPMSSPAPPPPPSMQQGNAGAEAMAPRIPTNSSTEPTSSAPTSAPMGNDPGGADAAGKQAMLYTADDGTVRERPSIVNPTGAGDEYLSNTWEGPLRQAPRQSPELRGINTPQHPPEPIAQTTSTAPRPGDEEEGEEDEDRREASRHIVSTAAFATTVAGLEAR